MKYLEALKTLGLPIVVIYATITTAMLVQYAGYKMGEATKAQVVVDSGPKPFVVICPYCGNRLTAKPPGSTGAIGATIKK